MPRNDSTRRNQRAALDHDVVEHDGGHADQHIVVNDASMNDRRMADGHTRAELRVGTAPAGVDEGQILNVCVRADTNPSFVAAQHTTKPDTGACGNSHIANDGRIERDEYV